MFMPPLAMTPLLLWAAAVALGGGLSTYFCRLMSFHPHRLIVVRDVSVSAKMGRL